MGGKPSKGTKKDRRIRSNKKSKRKRKVFPWQR